jgi:single-strand DNA-binding protein
MAGSINRVQLLGYLGKDPEVRATKAGKRVATFSLATTETWKDASGERQNKTEWHRIVVFNDGLVGVVEKYLKKGSRVILDGSLQTRSYTANDGQDRSVTEVVVGMRGELTMIDGRESGGEKQSKSVVAAKPQEPTFDDDEIPF